MKKLIMLATLIILTGCVHFSAEKVMLKAGFTDKVYNESEASSQP